MENEREMKLSEIAESIEYLELKTPKEVVISYIRNILPVGDNWLISTVKGLYKFTRTGEFIKQIGRKGQGPDEYVNILGVDVDYERKEIVLADSQSLLFYDLDGNFLRKTSLNGFLFNIALSDSALWTCNLGLSEERFMATALNREGDTLATLPNPAYKQTRNTDGFYLADLYDFRVRGAKRNVINERLKIQKRWFEGQIVMTGKDRREGETKCGSHFNLVEIRFNFERR